MGPEAETMEEQYLQVYTAQVYLPRDGTAHSGLAFTISHTLPQHIPPKCFIGMNINHSDEGNFSAEFPSSQVSQLDDQDELSLC